MVKIKYMEVNMNNKEKVSQGVLSAIIKFIPLVILALLVIVFGFDLLIAAPIATASAIIVAMLTNRFKFKDTFEIGIKSASSITIVFFILMFAYGVAECFMATGVGASVINIALSMGVSGKTVAVAGFLVTCVLSVATGTSWGTFAACAPIFLWLNYIVDGNIILTVCSIAGGACFGDNIGLISDTTVLSSGLQGVEIIHRVKHQGVWSISCLIISAIIILLLGMGLSDVVGDPRQAIDSIPPEAYTALAEERPSAILLLEQVKTGVPIYMIIPLFVVVGMAFAGIQTMICLGAGMVTALIFGMIAGTTTVTQWLEDMLLVGFGDAGSWSIVMMMWVSAFGGIMNSMNAFEPLAKLIVRISGNVRQLMGWCGVLCLAGNVALADETAEIATISPIMRNIVEENVEGSPEAMYKLRLRLATFADALGVYGSQLIPWHCFIVFYTAIANAVFPIYKFVPTDMIRMNVMSIIAVISILVLTFTGLDKYIPLFKLPSEPEVKLNKKQKKQVQSN